jgi:DNA-binding HxlR family transcriptional regulator
MEEVTKKCYSNFMVTQKRTYLHIYPKTCHSRRVLDLIADQWTALVIAALEEDTRRFSDLLIQVDGISRKMLTQTLRNLERNGLVKRVVYPVVPPAVEYSLTPLGQSLIEPMRALRQWAFKHMDEVEFARDEYDQADKVSVQETTAALVQQRQNNLLPRTG